MRGIFVDCKKYENALKEDTELWNIKILGAFSQNKIQNPVRDNYAVIGFSECDDEDGLLSEKLCRGIKRKIHIKAYSCENGDSGEVIEVLSRICKKLKSLFPALVLADSLSRLAPGVLSDDECFEEESHYNGLLEYPQYTKPAVWRDRAVPDVLLSGHHANVEKWRREQMIIRTADKRPDMIEKADLTDKEKKFLEEYLKSKNEIMTDNENLSS